MKNLNKTLSLFFVILVIGFSACNDKQKLQDGPQLKDANIFVTNNYQIIIDETKFNTVVSDDYTLSNAYIENDSLKIEVQYGGGCGLATFELITDGIYMESDPVQLNVKLSFNDEDDCEAYLTKPISFDLKNLAQHYQNNYQMSSGTMIIHLQDFSGELHYSF